MKNLRKLIFCFVTISCAVVVASIFLISQTNYFQNAMELRKIKFLSNQIFPIWNQESNVSTLNKIVILYWGYPWGLKSYVPPEGQFGDGCEVIHNRERIAEAHVVIFHFTAISSQIMPWRFYRNPDQKFVWWSAENPAVLRVSHESLDAFDNFFNWTLTYRRDAEMLGNYGYRANVINSLPRGKKVVDDIIASKKKLAIWFVSQCDYTAGARKRLAFANELRKAGLKFDGYGKCFPDSPHFPQNEKEKLAIKEHKFYFAFENALHCKDYITEKFWVKGVGLDAVPIVWGPTKEDILSVAPLDSFIFAEDFESSEKLVDYIKFLDKHDDEYRKYFRWREDENMTDAKMIAMTKERYPRLNIQEPPKSLCGAAREHHKKRKIIKSLRAEFIENNPKECA